MLEADDLGGCGEGITGDISGSCLHKLEETGRDCSIYLEGIHTLSEQRVLGGKKFG